MYEIIHFYFINYSGSRLPVIGALADGGETNSLSSQALTSQHGRDDDDGDEDELNLGGSEAMRLSRRRRHRWTLARWRRWEGSPSPETGCGSFTLGFLALPLREFRFLSSPRARARLQSRRVQISRAARFQASSGGGLPSGVYTNQ